MAESDCKMILGLRSLGAFSFLLLLYGLLEGEERRGEERKEEERGGEERRGEERERARREERERAEKRKKESADKRERDRERTVNQSINYRIAQITIET
ncbi:uncharacterized protein EAE98_003452 [Botrytis deweyae]|uniref:Uncharacterized protein n=1 Tax=Botrytis deweyae TaxID=2478750 RepID=A0ABQ7IUD4_9HELO|nr:uncharacterized protein EAE98_003452 [Botrytis deweyae]KAF7933743.1 hypothetical protein EAE98_003452 [Botrytis deweyae]